MTRKQLTATEILHGARAYSHNASRRAHQLSGPRRVVGMAEPVGEAIDGDEMCVGGCGFRFCAKRGPCAPVQPPARAVEAASAGRFVVGQRVRMRPNADTSTTVPEMRRDGFEGVIVALNVCSGRMHRVTVEGAYANHAGCADDNGRWLGGHQNVLISDIEPLSPATTVEGESDPIAQCAQLGIRVEESGAFPGCWLATLPGQPALVASVEGLDREACARAALTRYAVARATS